MSASWCTKWRWHTGLSADSVEWCPVEGYRHLLVCGTYQLDKDADQQSKQKRLGRIYLFNIDDSTSELIPVQTIETTGILDQKWCYHKVDDHIILAVATSSGDLELYRLINSQLEIWMKASIGQDILALSLDWSTNRMKDEPNIVVSDSSGAVTVFRLGESLERVGTWKSHGFEAWIAAFDYWNTNVFYSGGDDCLFKSYDARVQEVAQTTNRSHEAGVTAIRSHLDVEYQLLTGSYDERVRLWDARSLKHCVHESNLNGGIWRLKWHPFKKDILLAACMYGGFRMVKLGKGFEVLCEYMEHESIAYGADWKWDDQRHLVVTCSFYDCELRVSEVGF